MELLAKFRGMPMIDQQETIAMNSSPRTVQRVIRPETVSDGAGVKLQRSIASRMLDYLDPFLLLDHFGSENSDDYVAGFPMHPHRGIETVTYMRAGVVSHKDSLGHAGTIGAGDVQWMTAGSGILHEEMPELRGGRLDGFQLWVNLPARLKMTQPRYQEVSAARIPLVRLENGAEIKIIAGEFAGTTGAVSEIAADPTYLDVQLPPLATLAHSLPSGHTVFAYVYEGGGKFAGQLIGGPCLVVFSDGDRLEVGAGATGMRFLLVSGRPLGEPVARYGPFVMNTEEEIREAIRDLQRGTFVKFRDKTPPAS